MRYFALMRSSRWFSCVREAVGSRSHLGNPSRPLAAFGVVERSVYVTAAPVAGREHPAWIFLFENGQVSEMIAPSRELGCFQYEWSAIPEFDKRI